MTLLCTVYCVYCDPRGDTALSLYNAWLVGLFSSVLSHTQFSQSGRIHIFYKEVQSFANIHLHLNTK